MLKLIVISGHLLWAWLTIARSAVPLDSPTPQRLFAVPYGTARGAIYINIFPGKPEYEPPLVEGPSGLLVAPDGSRIVIVEWRHDSETYKIVEELLIYDRSGKFINKIHTVEEQFIDEEDKDRLPSLGLIDCIVYGLNKYIYIVKCDKILVYNDQGVFLDTLSNTYMRAAQGYEPLRKRIKSSSTPVIIGVDEKGTIYFDLEDEIITIDTEGKRSWVSTPSKGIDARLASDRGVLLMLDAKLSHEKFSGIYEIWVASDGRLKAIGNVPANTKIVEQLKQSYTTYLWKRALSSGQTYWRSYRKELKITKVTTIYGNLDIIANDIIVFDRTGHIRAEVPYFAAGDTPPVGHGSVLYWDIDAQGNIYYLRWAEKALEVWWVPIRTPVPTQ
ncbi:hypothetical protein HRbin15_02003 [bacterium HR15]|nr:hypothetical protein HRbin15_02003 [bacterium HR15]